MGGADAPGGDEVRVLGREESHLLGDGLLPVGDDGDSLHTHAQLPQRPRQEGTVSVHCVTLRERGRERQRERERERERETYIIQPQETACVVIPLVIDTKPSSTQIIKSSAYTNIHYAVYLPIKMYEPISFLKEYGNKENMEV